MSRARDLAGLFNLGPRSGTTAQRPATADVGDIYYNGTTGKTEIYTTTGWKEMASGIPFGNTAGRPTSPAVGQPYFNGEQQRLELYASTGWQNIVSETPGVLSVSGNYLESAGSGSITITGTNFTTGAVASAIGTNGVEVNASSTTVNSVVSVTAVFSGLSNSLEPYDIKVTNTSNLFGFLPDALYINASPVWQTASGSLGTFGEQVAMSVSAIATDDSTITYSLASGSTLPSGITLNSSTGLISGTLPDVATNTTYTFTINASDGSNPAIPRTFSFVSNAAPVWSTASGSLGAFNEGTVINLSVAATDASDSVSYSLASGSSLPSGITLNSSTGVISGTLPAITSNTTYTFTINASDALNNVSRQFSITSNNLVATDYLVIAGGGGGGGNTANGNQIMGGGGAGGYRSSWSTTGGGGLPENRLLLSTGTVYTILVGAQGAGGTGDSRGSQGGSSSISGSGITTVTSTGGGGGASQSQSAGVGGSGGGGSTFDNAGASRTASPVQGFPGGISAPYDSGRGGGGGGAGSAGVNGNNGGLGTGGAGLASDITGSSITRAGGGGGGRCNTSAFPIPGAGGAGGGGAGTSSSGTPGTSGSANTGSGGGAGYASNGGAGGSGVVILRTDSVAASTAGSPIYTNPSANVHIYQFNADGSITF